MGWLVVSAGERCGWLADGVGLPGFEKIEGC